MGIVILCRIGKLEGLAGNCGDWLRNISLVIHFGIELIIGFLGGFPIRFILTDSDFVDTRIFDSRCSRHKKKRGRATTTSTLSGIISEGINIGRAEAQRGGKGGAGGG